MTAAVDARPLGSVVPASLVRLILLTCAFASSISRAQAPADPADFNLSSPRPGIYVHLGRNLPLDVPGHDDIANISFVIGNRCVAVIDTGGSVRIGRELRDALRRRTALPICYVIDTHVHVDHVLGNFAFAGDKPSFVGHAALADALIRSRPFFIKEYGADFDGTASADQVIGPDRTVERGRELTLDLGSRVLRLRAWPTAHTDCDLTVLDERTATLWTGDLLFRGRLPALDGNLKGWLAAIDELSHLRARFVVPGHGSPTSDLGGALRREREYLAALDDGVKDELARGESMQDAIGHVATAERGRWALWDDVHPRNVAHAYEELQWE
jgi:quinoprotein relay system zinc metallohydrolase 2